MVRINPHNKATPAARPEKTAGLSAAFKKGVEITKRYFLDKGQRLVGAGKLPNFSDTPPQKGSERVKGAVEGSLTPAKRIKQK
jgi:hypothetical protein